MYDDHHQAPGCGQAPGAPETTDRAGHPATAAALRVRLAALQAQQDGLAHQIAALRGEPARPTWAEHVTPDPLPGSQTTDT
jgi:hypothetical protein